MTKSYRQGQILKLIRGKRIHTQDELAQGLKEMGIAATQVTFLSALIDAPGFIVELYHSGKCVNPEYLYKLRNLHEKFPEQVESQVVLAETISRQWVDQTTATLNTAVIPVVAPPEVVVPTKEAIAVAAGPVDAIAKAAATDSAIAAGEGASKENSLGAGGTKGEAITTEASDTSARTSRPSRSIAFRAIP